MTPNLLAFPIAFLGIIRAGAAQVNVNPLYTPRELEHQLNDAGVETIVVFSGVSGTVAEVIAEDEAEDRHHHRRRRRQRREHSQPAGRCAPDGCDQPGRCAGRRRQAALQARSSSAATTCCSCNTPAAPPGCRKGASLSHRNLVANVEQFKAFMPDTLRAGEEVIVTAIPLYHIFALMVNFITYFSVGADNWLVPNPRDFDGFIDTMKKARPSVFMGVNTLYAGLVAHPKSEGDRLVEPEARRRRRRGGDRRRLGQVAGDDRHLHPRRLRPVGDQPGRELQPGLGAEASTAPPDCRCRRPTSSCSTTTARKSRSAKPARSSPRARR